MLVFYNIFGKSDAKLEMIGIDTIFGINEDFLAMVPSASSIKGDARNLQQYIKSPVDLIVNSNAQVVHPVDGWDSDIEATLRTMHKVHRQGGLVLHTFYSEAEATRTKNLLKANYNVKVCEQNKHRVPEISPRHEYVVLGIRK